MIRLATFTALTALSLAAAAQAGELTPRASTLRFGDRFGGEPIRVAAEAPPRIAARPTLKSEATIVGDLVRIGDLIENAGDVADVAIFRAPDIGQTGTVPASRVAEAVLPHRIIALDTRGLAEVVVTRASRSITEKDIEARIVRALAGHSGLPDADNLTITFDNFVRSLQVEAAVTSDLRITRLGFDPRSRRFDVSFDLPGSAVARKLPLRFTGVVGETFEALVLARAIAQGGVIGADDLVTARRPRSEAGPTIVRETDQAVGFAAKRALRAGQVIRRSDLAKPELVARNASVTITYAVPGVVVSIRGQALEPGALGDVINVLNVQSKKTLQATVTGPGRVSVTASHPRLANLPSNEAR